VLEVVERRERGRAREMRVKVDAARKDELARRVDVALRSRDVADGGDATAVDADIRARASADRDDGPAADG
jgi:hypothetical protein